MANKVYGSPGVYTSEKQLTYSTETLGVTTLGIAGESLKGPAFQPIFIKEFDDFKVTFGGTNPEKFKNTQIVKNEMAYIAKAYLAQSNQLYITRILGLSGYNAGTAYALRALGACDIATLEETTGATLVNFTVTLDDSIGLFTATSINGNPVVSGSTELIDVISDVTGVDVADFETAYYTFFNITSYTTKNWYKNNVLYWGIVSDENLDIIEADRDIQDLTGINDASFIDAYVLSDDIPAEDRDINITNNEFVFVEDVDGQDLTDKYMGNAFGLFAYNITSATPTTITGTVKIYNYEQTALPIADYHKKLIATLRSRGTYSGDNFTFKVNPSTVDFNNNAEVLVNPFATFDVVGETTGAVDFTYTVSLKSSNKNYIKNVLGTTPSDKTTNLFVEEVYDSVLTKGWDFGKIKGIHPTIVKVPVNINGWAHLKHQYQSPVTPFFVSELRGDLPQRLFRFVSISDGGGANTAVKISIGAVNLAKKIFDVYVRAYNDSDKNPVYLERFLSVSMDEKQDNYIGRKIGTIDNKYPLKSSYVIVEMAENAPADGVACGFEGYEFRTYGDDALTSTYVGVPLLSYKTKYYAAGETIVNPPYGTAVISRGDKVKKVFLGFSDVEYGYDSDLLKFKGKAGDPTVSNAYNNGQDWGTLTQGFHLDVNAGLIIDGDGNQVFAVGVGSFTDSDAIEADSAHPYNDIKTRKFTALLSGGFDGWDIYRDSRTNTDDYVIGRTGFNDGGFATFTSVEYVEDFGTSDYYAYLLAAKTFENPEETVINILATPGIDLINNTDLCESIIEIVEEKRMDCVYLPTIPDIKVLDNANASNSDEWLYPDAIVDELDSTGIDSNYTSVFYPWIQILDTDNNANVFIPPTAEIVKNLALTDNISHPWYASAGYDRGLVTCVRARISLNQEHRDTLYKGRINPIATFTDIGNVIWGNRNLQIEDSPLDRINVRRLLLQARKLIISVSNRLLFDPNDATIRSEFLSLVNPILDNIRKERGLSDFRVKLESENEDDDRNTLRGKIFLKPVYALEFIELEFVVTPTSVSFDNI